MTPAARIAAAVGILDVILAGQPAEPALLGWSRRSRFAGSADRAAVRDLVFDALRCKRSYAALGGAETGRGLMIGRLRDSGVEPQRLLTGEGFAARPLTLEEQAFLCRPPMMTEAERLDCPDWMVPLFREALGDRFAATLAALRARAPVWLRVNLARVDPATARRALDRDGIATRPHSDQVGALEVLDGDRRIRGSIPYRDGWVELQDIASQSAMHVVPLKPGDRVLDYCAGGGGKTLALAARCPGARFHAHDADPRRMTDLPARARRAGVRVTICDTARMARFRPFDLVLCDLPCSGTGAWRRTPDAKWRLNQTELDRLVALQAQILDEAAGLLAPAGRLAVATCSMLTAENDDQIRAFCERHPGWRVILRRQWLPPGDGDGFFLAVMAQTSAPDYTNGQRRRRLPG